MATIFTLTGLARAKLWIYGGVVATHWLSSRLCDTPLGGLATQYHWLNYNPKAFLK
jgi:hypothetical protein|tara:strand:+ start:55 stop:222 length:168 start_codon:yes stop_codon:yes gene_type:complete